LSSGGSEVKASACNVGDLGSIPGLGRSPGEGNGNPLQYSCLVNPMDGGAWWATVHGVPKSRTQLRDFTSLQFTREHRAGAGVAFHYEENCQLQKEIHGNSSLYILNFYDAFLLSF